MGTFNSRNPEDFARALKEIEERTAKMAKRMDVRLVKAAVTAGRVIEARAKEIITEKGHIVTGTLRRSINTQPFAETHLAGAEVGTWVEYAEHVEALPDGGYLNEAAEQRFKLAVEILAKEGIEPELRKWAQ